MNEWALAYLGKPWVAGAMGPDAFDCWGLVVDIYKRRLGIDLSPHSGIDRDDHKELAIAASGEVFKNWYILANPQHLCAVGLSNTSGKIFHVGVYLTGLVDCVIHCKRGGGCVIETIDSLRSNYKFITYYGLRN